MKFSEPEPSRPVAPGLQMEIKAQSGSRLRLIWLLGILVLLATATAVTLTAWSPGATRVPSSLPLPPEQSALNPTITWSDSIDIILSPGENASRSFTVASSVDLSNVVIEAVPAIAPFLAIDPNKFSRLKAKEAQNVQVSFAIPTTATLGTYTGTLHVRVGRQTFPQTLKVTVNVWPKLTSPLFTFKYPALPAKSSRLVPIGDGNSYEYQVYDSSVKEYLSTFVVSFVRNDGALDPAIWVHNTLDPSGCLTGLSSFERHLLPSGAILFRVSASISTDCIALDGPLPYAIIFDPSGTRIVSITTGQDDPLPHLNYSVADITGLLDDIIKSFQFQ